MLASPGEALASIIIPCYNQAHYLRECLDSVRAQTIPHWEAIVVDDGSPDGPEIEAVISSLDDPRIRLVQHDKNRGLAAVRNTGIRTARAELVVCVDADDLLADVYLERVLPSMTTAAIDAVFTDYIRFGSGQAEVRRAHVPSSEEILLRQPLIGAGFLMTCDLWKRVGGYDESPRLRLGREDWEFYVRVFTTGCRAAHVAEPLYFYRRGGASAKIEHILAEPRVCAYVYRKHRNLFDGIDDGRRTVERATDRAASWALAVGARKWAFALTLKSMRYGVTFKRARKLARTLCPDNVLVRIRRILHGVRPGNLSRTPP